MSGLLRGLVPHRPPLLTLLGIAIDPGESVTHEFDTLGTHRYHCSVHAQNMKGSVIVTAETESS